MADAGAGQVGAGDAGAAGAAGAGQAGAGAAAPWHGITEPEIASYVENKGWKAPADVIKSYQGAEKLIGRDPSTLLPIPRADDPAGFRSVMAKLGLPETPDKYEFAKAEGITPDEGYVGWAKSTFHKVGMTAAQVKELTAEHNAYVAAQLKQQETDYNLAVEADKKALLAEWKGGHERMMTAAKTAVAALGFTQPMIDAMERTVGYAATMKHFAELGQKLGESSFSSGATKTNTFGPTMAPAEAKAEWEKMKADPVMVAALKDTNHPNHKSAKEKQTQLFAIMYPE